MASFKNANSFSIPSPEYCPVLFDVFGKFSKSVLDDLRILQGILNFEQYLPKVVDDWQIGISKLRQRF